MTWDIREGFVDEVWSEAHLKKTSEVFAKQKCVCRAGVGEGNTAEQRKTSCLGLDAVKSKTGQGQTSGFLTISASLVDVL